ncbi:MAG TPA: rhomboid family intramembrane serine protease [Solirubrobacteraceae bacterium]|nr:rhomboid family intramembrane serine protease [Solirubrobacteraceae bacterium]
MVVYLLAIEHGGSILSGPSLAVTARYSAIPYALTHPASHCALLTAEGLAGLESVIACSTHAGALARQLPAPVLSETRALPTWETIFTSMFLHASLLHIGGNMLFLAIFGPAVEDRLGAPRFLAFYLIGGVIALAAQVGAGTSSTAPVLGASGAIAAVLGAYFLLFPRARVLTLVFIFFFFTIIELPAALLLALWLALQVLEAEVSGTGSGGGVANFAHIGGFLFGLALIRAFLPARSRLRPPSPALPRP